MKKTTLPPDDQLDAVFHALSNRTRRALIDKLTKGPAMVTELAKPFGMSLNAISKHLIVLERAGLIKRTIEGRVHSCALELSPAASLDEWLRVYKFFWTKQTDLFADFLDAT